MRVAAAAAAAAAALQHHRLRLDQEGSGGGSGAVGSVVAFGTSDPRFESHHHIFFHQIC